MPAPTHPIAIVGAGCYFPGGENLDSFTSFLRDSGHAIAELPKARYDADLYFDPQRGTMGKSYCWRGAMLDLERIPVPTAPRLSAESAKLLDSLQRVSLCAAAEAFASAGLTGDQLVDRDVQVILGVSRPSVRTFDHAFVHAIERLVSPLGDVMTGDSSRDIRAAIVRRVQERYSPPHGAPWPATGGRQIAGVIANAYGLRGRHAVIDAACASTFAALATAKRSLEQGTADLVLMGASAIFDPYTLVLFAQARSLTESDSYPFDARASGFIPGEGSGMFVLERLADAVANGRRILGVIRGVGSSCDGAGKATWAPRKEGQILAIERAYASGQVDPAEVQVVEAHATSTPLGDSTEVAALADVFGRGGSRAPLHIGTVKGNIGHALSAAGAAGLSKILGAFKTGMLPPSIGYSSPNPKIDWERIPLRIAKQAVSWPSGAPRVAALDSFGIGGLNYHVVVEDAPTAERAQALLRRATAPSRARIAVIGTGAYLAGARNADEQARVAAGGSAVTRPLDEHRTGGHVSVRSAALVDLPKPDPAQLKIPPKLIENYDPLQFMILDAANQAFASVEPRGKVDRTRVGVFVGTSQISDFFIDVVLAVRLAEVVRLVTEELERRGVDGATRAKIVGEFAERAQSLLPRLTDESAASVGSGLSSRTAKSLDVNGPVLTVDSGGAGSSLAALEIAAQALAAGDCDVAIVAGGDRALRAASLASRQADAHPVPGEGAAAVALRRFDDALSSNDAVSACIVAISGASTGDFAKAARSDTDTVQRAAQLFGDCDGATGLIALQLAVQALRDANGQAADRVASVVTAGPWATAYQVSLDSGRASSTQAQASAATRAAEPVVLRGESRAALWSALKTTPATELVPGAVLGQGPVAVALRASTLEESRQVAGTALTSAEGASFLPQGVAVSEVLRRETCFLFPGLGSPYEGMLRALVDAYPSAARRLAELDTLIAGHAGRTMSEVLERDSGLFSTTVEWAQYASLSANLVTFEVAAAHGFTPAYVSGHSFGEYAALVVAGVLELEDAVRIATLRAECLAKWTRPGTMSSVFATRERLAKLLAGLPGFVAESNINSPEEVVVSGDREGMAAFLERCRVENVQARQLTVPAAFHCELLRPACEPFARAIANIPLARPKIPVISSVTSREITDRDEIRRCLVEQLVAPVNFIAQIEYAHSRGIQRFIETGAGNVLARLATKILGRRPAVAVSFDERRKREKAGLGAVENALVALRAGEGAVTTRPARPTIPSPMSFQVAGEPASALFGQDEWRELAEQPDWDAFWVQSRPSLALFARDLYARSRPVGVPAAKPRPTPVAAAAPPPPPQAVKLFDATSMRAARPVPAAPVAEAAPPRSRAPSTAPTQPARDTTKVADEVGALVVDNVVQLTGYPRELVRFDQELEADLGVDTVKQVELLGALRAHFDLAADESVTVSDLPTLAQLRDYLVRCLLQSNGAAASNESTRVAAPTSSKPRSRSATEDVSAEVGAMLVDLVVGLTGYPRELVRFDQELEADLGIDTVKQVELLGTVRAHLDLPADESVTVADVPTLAQLRDHVVKRLAQVSRNGAAAAVAPSTDDDELEHDVEQLIVDLVVTLTGYPRELVRLDQELEADLGVDTVKQVELLGSIRAQLDLAADESVTVSDLPTIALLRKYVVARCRSGAGRRPQRSRTSRKRAAGTSTKDADSDEPGDGARAAHALGELLDVNTLPGLAAPAVPLTVVDEQAHRFVPRARRERAEQAPQRYAPPAIVVVGTGALVEELGRSLRARGTLVSLVDIDGATRAIEQSAGGHLPDLCLAYTCERTAPDASLRQQLGLLLDRTQVTSLVDLVRAWLRRVGSQSATLSALTSLGGRFGLDGVREALIDGAGLVGMFRSLRHEHKTVRFKAVDVDPRVDAATTASALLRELDTSSSTLWTGSFRNERYVMRLVPAVAGRAGAADPALLERLRAMPSVLVTGGARGITATISARLVELSVKRLDLVGRTPLPPDLDRWRAVAERGELRDAVLAELRARGDTFTPASWNSEVQRIDAALEIARNLSQLASTGCQVHYHAVDIADRAAVGTLLQQIAADVGPVRAIVHGAGIQRSRALLGKSVDDFVETLEPKLGAAVNLLELSRDSLELFVGFSSVAGHFGNHGQSDYGMASAALDALLAAYAATSSAKVVSISWPAWDEVGMAVRGGTRDQLERRGRTLMSVAEGGNHFIRELAQVDSEPVAVIAGPTVGDPDGQRPNPEQFRAHADLARASEVLPLIDVVVDAGPEAFVVEYHASTLRDAALGDHRIDGQGLLPAVASLELLAEISALARGSDSIGVLEDVSLTRPFKLADEAVGRVVAEARVDGDSLALTLSATHHDRRGGVVAANQTFVTGRAPAISVPDPAPPWRAVSGRRIPYEYRDLIDASGTQVIHGPSMRTLSELLIGDDMWHAAVVTSLPAWALRAARPRAWRVPAPLLDGCLVACGAIMALRGLGGLPFGFARVRLFAAPRDGEACQVVIHERGQHGANASFDFTAYGSDRRPLLAVDGYVRRQFPA